MAWVFLLASVLFTVLGQLVYKQYGMNKQMTWLLGGICLFSLAVPFTMWAVRDLGIGMFYVGSSISYMIAPLLGQFFFNESVTLRQWSYFGLIMLGVIVYAW
jgi:multidrug transporter EmrE-like cation transporter